MTIPAELYWALVAGKPERPHGLVDLPLAKRVGAAGERVVALDYDEDLDLDEAGARRAKSRYRTIDNAASRVTWLARAVGVPYLPITPTFPALGPLGLLPLPAKWCVRFGPPLELHRRHDAAAAEDRILVGKLAEEVRQTIQAMV